MQASDEFEWDENKNRSNIRKHDVSFEDVLAIWNDPMLAIVHLASSPEDRWAAIGQAGKDDYLTAIITYRGEKVRIISARQSTKREVDVYDRH